MGPWSIDVIEISASVFAAFTVYGCGATAVLYGLMLLIFGIPVYVWRQRRRTDARFGESFKRGNSNMKRRWIAAGVLAAAGLSANVQADETRTEGLNFELTPYAWGAGIDGKLQVGGESVHFNRDFSDIWDNTDAAFMGLAVISYDRFVLYADYDYLSLSNDERTRRGLIFPAGTKVSADTDLDVGTYGGGYRFDTFGKNTIDVLIGAQITNIDETLKAAGNQRENKESLTDTMLILRPSFQFAEHWRFNPTLAYGVSGDSDTTYSLMPQLAVPVRGFVRTALRLQAALLQVQEQRQRARCELQRPVPRIRLDVPGARRKGRSCAGAGTCTRRQAEAGARRHGGGEVPGCGSRRRMRCGRSVSEYAGWHARQRGRLRVRLRADAGLPVQLGRTARRGQGEDR